MNFDTIDFDNLPEEFFGATIDIIE